VEIINSAIKSDQPVDFIVLDECHRYAGNQFYSIFHQRNPKLILGLSATFERLDGAQILLEQYCPVCDVITLPEAIANKWVSPYKEYKVLIEAPDIELYREYNQKFINSFSFFNFDFDTAMKCLTDIVYRRTFAKAMGLPQGEIDAVTFTWGRMLKARKYFVMDHPKKVEITRKILDYRPNSKAITFSPTKKQADEIKRGYVVHSGKTKKKNAITIEEFSKLKTGVLHGVKGVNEGTDIDGVNLAIMLCNNSSTQEKTQKIGRAIRFEENKEAEIFTLVIKGTVEEAWYNTSTNGKTYIEITEEELDIILAGGELQNLERTAEKSDVLFRL
jgi:superfamily II DNA or RNA helicase